MIEQNIAELWRRAQTRPTQKDAIAAREALRELGLNPYAPPPPPPVEVKSGDEDPAPSPGAGEEEDTGGVAPAEAAETRPAAAGRAPRQVTDEASPAPLRPGEESGPKPHRVPRGNEWTRPKMAGFLRELAASHNVSQAAKSVGMGRQSAYKLRSRLAGTPFALAWEVALETGLQHLAHALLDRALNGEEVPVFYHGEKVGSYRKHDNRLGAWLLDNPWKLGRHQVARETMSSRWDALVARIEADGPGWEHGGFVEAPEIHAQQAENDEVYMAEQLFRSWYEAHPANPAGPAAG